MYFPQQILGQRIGWKILEIALSLPKKVFCFGRFSQMFFSTSHQIFSSFIFLKSSFKARKGLQESHQAFIMVLILKANALKNLRVTEISTVNTRIPQMQRKAPKARMGENVLLLIFLILLKLL